MELNILEKIYAYSTTWAEEAIERHPFLSALVMAMIIDQIIW